jgi:dihydrofolate reductase
VPEIRGFIAATLDGYIADTDGGIEWLNEFGDSDYGYEDFVAEVDTVVIGRKTFDQVTEMAGWPYEGKRAVLVTNREVEALPEGVEAWAGEVSELVEVLREKAEGDVWVIGGSSLQKQFLEANGLDRIEVFIVPLLLGDGIPLWPKSEIPHRLEIESATALEAGMLRLEYTIHPID